MDENQQSAIERLVAERDDLKRHCVRLQEIIDQVGGMGYPPGHYYSPITDIHDPFVIRAVEERLTASTPAGVQVDREAMKSMLRRLAAHHLSFHLPGESDGVNRFYFDNPFFGCHDASVYLSMLLEFRPRRVVEVGSGFSSRLLLDTNARFFDNALDITLIDPSLASLTNLDPPPGTAMLACRLQEAPLGLFERLEANDILFIDSSHVSKTGSDVNFYLFEIFPRLKRGVLIHIHDIFWPFEYLAEWVLGEKRSWNEAYALRAFLQYNTAFEILYWNNFVFHFLGAELKESMPLCMENEGGSLWIRKNQ